MRELCTRPGLVITQPPALCVYLWSRAGLADAAGAHRRRSPRGLIARAGRSFELDGLGELDGLDPPIRTRKRRGYRTLRHRERELVLVAPRAHGRAQDEPFAL